MFLLDIKHTPTHKLYGRKCLERMGCFFLFEGCFFLKNGWGGKIVGRYVDLHVFSSEKIELWSCRTNQQEISKCLGFHGERFRKKHVATTCQGKHPLGRKKNLERKPRGDSRAACQEWQVDMGEWHLSQAAVFSACYIASFWYVRVVKMYDCYGLPLNKKKGGLHIATMSQGSIFLLSVFRIGLHRSEITPP